jgi:hypothetical protein
MELMQDLLVMHIDEFSRKQRVIAGIRYYDDTSPEEGAQEEDGGGISAWASSSPSGCASTSLVEEFMHQNEQGV